MQFLVINRVKLIPPPSPPAICILELKETLSKIVNLERDIPRQALI